MDDVLDALPDSWKNRIIILLVGVLVGVGSGSGLGYFRVGKFTDEMGRQLEQRMIERVDALAREYRANHKKVVIRLTDIEHTDRDLEKIVNKAVQIVESHEKESRVWMGRIQVNESRILSCEQAIEKFWQQWYRQSTN